MNEKYEQIIHLPHHISETHPPMPTGDRAAQFSPFAALTGYDDSVSEAARLTEDKEVRDEDKSCLLSGQIAELMKNGSGVGEITVRYFAKDSLKSGGSYREKTGFVRRVDEFSRKLIFTDGDEIAIDDISDINGDFFDNLF